MGRKPKRICAACGQPSVSYMCYRCYAIQSKFKVNPKDIQDLRVKQRNTCAICGKRDNLGIDRDEVTRKVRGLLCISCNMGLGYLHSEWHLQRALDYLKHPPISDVDQKPIEKAPKFDGALLPASVWKATEEIKNNNEFPSMRAKARYIAQEMGITEEAAMSRLRRVKIVEKPLDK